MICTRCYFKGEPKTKVPGSFIIELGLWLLFFPVGIIYSIWRLASKGSGCPSCGSKDMIPTDSPRAAILMRGLK